MTFAAHISIGETPDDVRSLFNYECMTRIAARRPDDHFIFIFDKPWSDTLITSKNITPVLLGPALKNKLLQHYWYQFKLPRVLQKYQADVYVNQDKSACLQSNIRQVMVLEDLAFLDPSNLYPARDRRYLKKFFHKFVQKSQSLVLCNESLSSGMPPSIKKHIRESIHIKPGKPDMQPVREKALTDVQETCGDKMYFLYPVTASTSTQLITALKAFSIFKKWQQSNMQFLIASQLPPGALPLQELSNYKYRADVQVLYYNETLRPEETLSQAYVCVYLPSTDQPERIPALAAQMGVPLIRPDRPFQYAESGEGSAYCAISEKSIADQMMRLYKDEAHRASLRQSALAMARELDWEESSRRLEDVLTGGKDRTFALH